ncbi:EscU/YscU/HrcU family type III secretion system export apparatus switch protein [Treponema sp. R6D11]
MKKRKIASAIGYTSGDPAPVLLASGRDREAQRIIEIAQEAGVAVVEDSALAALLDTSVKPGDFIPSWCWEAAVKVLAFVIKADKSPY